MEVTGAVFGQVPCFKDYGVHGGLKQRRMVCRTRVRCCDNGFSDKSHVEYYNGGTKMSMEIKVKEEKKELKKKMKMLKGLSKNLGMFSEMGFGLNVDGDVELDQKVKGQMISEATDVLVAQLQKLKAEKMESKRIKKEEKAKKKAAKMMMECKSSSESSSSSESDCDNVMNMKEMKTKKTSNTCQETPISTPLSLALPVQIYEKVENKVTENTMLNDLTLVEEGSKKIEVCMGGKCKKSGAAMLMENFQRAVGEEVAVVGCKCMGKCKDGPNVRVRSEDGATASPLCIGVGLEDVDTIVTNFFGESHSQCSVMVPALSSV